VPTGNVDLQVHGLTAQAQHPIITELAFILSELWADYCRTDDEEPGPMKAQHRRELQTNVLADRVGRLVQGIRQNPKSSATVVWIIIGLIIGTGVIWYFLGSGSGSSSQWLQLESASDPAKLEQIIKENPGTIAARTARFQKSRMELQEGLRTLFSADRARAINNLIDARRNFLELAVQCANEPILVQEALTGAAKAEESLIGVTRSDNNGQPLGTLDRATELYGQVAKSYPDSYLGKAAANHVADLEKSRTDVEKFYAELNKFADSKSKK
jgi:hypothetical protein